MNTHELTVSLPLSLSEEEVKTLLAVKLYEAGKVSLGQASEMAGFSKRAFIEILGRHHVSVFGYTAEELRREVGA